MPRSRQNGRASEESESDHMSEDDDNDEDYNEESSQDEEDEEDPEEWESDSSAIVQRRGRKATKRTPSVRGRVQQKSVTPARQRPRANRAKSTLENIPSLPKQSRRGAVKVEQTEEEESPKTQKQQKSNNIRRGRGRPSKASKAYQQKNELEEDDDEDFNSSDQLDSEADVSEASYSSASVPNPRRRVRNSAATTKASPKKRGRPPKRRGRPPKKTLGGPPAKRRGRPPQKKADNLFIEEQSAESDKMSEDDENQSSRPLKKLHDGPPAKIRGRPPKKKTNDVVIPEEQPGESDHSMSSEEDENEVSEYDDNIHDDSTDDDEDEDSESDYSESPRKTSRKSRRAYNNSNSSSTIVNHGYVSRASATRANQKLKQLQEQEIFYDNNIKEEIIAYKPNPDHRYPGRKKKREHQDQDENLQDSKNNKKTQQKHSDSEKSEESRFRHHFSEGSTHDSDDEQHSESETSQQINNNREQNNHPSVSSRKAARNASQKLAKMNEKIQSDSDEEEEDFLLHNAKKKAKKGSDDEEYVVNSSSDDNQSDDESDYSAVSEIYDEGNHPESDEESILSDEKGNKAKKNIQNVGDDFGEIDSSSGGEEENDVETPPLKIRRKESTTLFKKEDDDEDGVRNSDHHEDEDEGSLSDTDSAMQAQLQQRPRLPQCCSTTDAITLEALPRRHICFFAPDNQSRQCFALETLHKITVTSSKPEYRNDIDGIKQTFLQPPHFRTAMSDDLIDQIASRFGRQALDVHGEFYNRDQALLTQDHYGSDDSSEDDEYRVNFAGALEDNNEFAERLRNYVTRTMGTQDVYACPLCYTVAHRDYSITQSDEAEDDNDNDNNNQNGRNKKKEFNSDDDFFFREDPMSVLGFPDNDEFKVAASFCFKRVASVKKHLRSDHGVDTSIVQGNDLYTRFKIRASDGLVQRYLKANFGSSQGNMRRYWFYGNSQSYIYLLGLMKQAETYRAILEGGRHDDNDSSNSQRDAAHDFMVDSVDFYTSFDTQVKALWDRTSAPYRKLQGEETNFIVNDDEVDKGEGDEPPHFVFEREAERLENLEDRRIAASYEKDAGSNESAAWDNDEGEEEKRDNEDSEIDQDDLSEFSGNQLTDSEDDERMKRMKAIAKRKKARQSANKNDSSTPLKRLGKRRKIVVRLNSPAIKQERNSDTNSNNTAPRSGKKRVISMNSDEE